MEPEDITPLPINGELDLHTFRPNEIKTLIPDYLDACMEAGIEEVRIIHGKGTGQLREACTVFWKGFLKSLPSNWPLSGMADGGQPSSI